MMRRRPRQVFWQDSCAAANSYYFNKDGDVPLRASLTLDRAGVDVLEVGVPFSEPLADGPVIQRATEATVCTTLCVEQWMNSLPFCQ